MPRQKKKSPQTGNSSIRIIGGRWRGRKLNVPEADGLRPTGDRMRETLFNWLMPYIHGARCLDAFAGTGALGLEALSRGAKFTHFVELNNEVANQLDHNLNLLESTNSQVHRSNFNQWQPTENIALDIIFIDPPFSEDLWELALEHLQSLPLSPEALVYVETPRDQILTTPESWAILKQKLAGQVCATLYETREVNPG